MESGTAATQAEPIDFAADQPLGPPPAPHYQLLPIRHVMGNAHYLPQPAPPEVPRVARAQWLADRQSELLPVPYFHVVFTVPAPIAEIALHNKAVVYGILFTAAAETLRVIAADPRHLGAEIGLVAVLHTWGQNLHQNPHS